MNACAESISRGEAAVYTLEGTEQNGMDQWGAVGRNAHRIRLPYLKASL